MTIDRGDAGGDSRLADYRGREGGVPEPVDDVEVSGAQARAAAPEGAAPRDDEPEAPKPVVDRSRRSIYDKFKRNRADVRAASVPRSHVPQIDGDEPQDVNDPSHPDYIAPNDDEPVHSGEASLGTEDRQPQVEPAVARSIQSEPAGGPTPYKLTVFGNQVIARDREELARLAEVDADEADEIPDATLIRLAQKQLAAKDRLEAAKEAERRARMAGVSPSATPADEDLLDQPGRSRAAAEEDTPVDLVDVVKELQFGDTETAAKKLNQAFQNGLRQHEAARTVDTVRHEVVLTLANLQTAHADLANDEDARDLVTANTTRLMVNELRKCGITEAEATQLSANPQMAAQAYIGAQSLPQFAGRIRKIDALASEAITNTRQRLGKAPKPVAPTQQPSAAPRPPQTRRDMKRALPQQPARAGTPLPTDLPMERGDDRKASASAAIAKMRAARHQ